MNNFFDLLFVLLASSDVQDYFSRYGYIGIYLFFVTIDQIAPVPEEITLIVIGYFSSIGYLNPFLAGAFSIAGFITIDTIYYYLTRSGNKLIKKMTKNTDTSRLKGYKQKMKEHTFKTLLILSFIPRMRLLAPIFVALLKIPFPKFLLYSVITLAIHAAIYISLGIIFHSSLSSLIEKSQTMGWIIFIAALIVMIVLSFVIARKLKAK
jgi:membrane protein DedA with SNARE-associated domain